MREWIDWYDSDHSIYVNARHRDVHFRRVATDILEFVPHPNAIVLDYSCGEALHADVIAARVEKLVLAEPAAGVRARLKARYAGNPKIEVRSIDELEALPKNSLDLAVMHSVTQYMTLAELAAALDLMRSLLKPRGQLVLGDIVAPDTIAAVDAAALLRFGLANGFFIAASTGLGIGSCRHNDYVAPGKIGIVANSGSRAVNPTQSRHIMQVLNIALRLGPSSIDGNHLPYLCHVHQPADGLRSNRTHTDHRYFHPCSLS